MTKFFAAFEDFFKSIYELFASILGTFASLINTVISTILNFFSGIVNLFADVFKGVVDVVGGVGKFVLGKSGSLPRWSSFQFDTSGAYRRFNNNAGNIVVIGVAAAGFYIYTRQQQGKPVVPAKKTN